MFLLKTVFFDKTLEFFMKLLMFAASLRKDSFNKQLITVAADCIRERGDVEIDLAHFSEFHAPIYNADDQNTTGFPQGISHFVDRLLKADGLIISSPEYNFSTPGTLKNLIDWVSRITPMP